MYEKIKNIQDLVIIDHLNLIPTNKNITESFNEWVNILSKQMKERERLKKNEQRKNKLQKINDSLLQNK